MPRGTSEQETALGDAYCAKVSGEPAGLPFHIIAEDLFAHDRVEFQDFVCGQGLGEGPLTPLPER